MHLKRALGEIWMESPIDMADEAERDIHGLI